MSEQHEWRSDKQGMSLDQRIDDRTPCEGNDRTTRTKKTEKPIRKEQAMGSDDVWETTLLLALSDGDFVETWFKPLWFKPFNSCFLIVKWDFKSFS
jgi:hypothetical protein